MADRSIRKMQVPAYFPVESGVQALEKRGVVVEVKKVMAIVSMPIIDVLECMSMESDVELGIGIPVLEGAIVIWSIDIVSILLTPWPWERVAEDRG